MPNDDNVENALENKNCSFSLFFHEAFMCLEDVVVDVDVVDFKLLSREVKKTRRGRQGRRGFTITVLLLNKKNE